jgi:RNA polymerase sigma-32 factor
MNNLAHSNDSEAAMDSEKTLPMAYDPLRAYLKEVSAHPVLSREEEFEAARLVYEQKDRDAAQKLVLSNLKLVVKISLEYYNAYLNILDVIQEGNVGLLHAVQKYSPYKDTKFSTYASFWIKAYILKYIMDSWSLVKIGTTQAQRKLFYGLNRERRKLESLGIDPSTRRLSSTLGVKEAEVEQMTQRLGHTDISLDTPLHDESSDTVMDTIANDDNVEEIVSRNEESEVISQKVLEFRGGLNDKEAFIFDRRILAEEPETLQEIGTKFNISRERVRQLEIRVMKRLRRSFEGERAALGM